MAVVDSEFNRRSTRSIYDDYINTIEGDGKNKSQFETRTKFREGFSRYNMQTRTVTAGTLCQWDRVNCSGVPMDYDPQEKTLYVDGSDAHTLVIGATGARKSRLVVMPMVRTLAAASENMIICDPKGEIYQRTASYLKDEGYAIHAINLHEPSKGDGWNMLAVPYELYLSGDIDKACEFVNDMTINLVPITAKDPYWDYSARDMLFGLILLLFKIAREKKQDIGIVNMQGVLKLREELFCSAYSSEIQNTRIWEYAKGDSLIRTRLIGTVICPEKTLSCIISTFDQHMSCFSLQPQVVNMLSVSTFDLQNIGFGKDVIFLIVPDEKSTYHKIVTIFIKQIYELLIDNVFKRTDNNRYPVRINFILDEFSSLPTISDFPQMVTASRSRNIRFTLIVQSKHQLRQRYGEETDTIMSNCTNWMFLTSRETELLRELSELSGTTGNSNEPLVSVSRLQHLNKDAGECLIFSGRKYPYFAKLPDIEEYDCSQYAVLGMQRREALVKYMEVLSQLHYFEALTTPVGEPPERCKPSEGNVSAKEEAELRAELERKFDELFGEPEKPKAEPVVVPKEASPHVKVKTTGKPNVADETVMPTSAEASLGEENKSQNQNHLWDLLHKKPQG